MSGLRFPRVMPAAWYRDPAEVLGERLLFTPPALVLVSCETATEPRAVHPPARRDTYYTQARRLHIRNLMRGR